MDDREQAITELEALAKVPGALKIITSEVHPDYREDKKDPKSPPKDGVDVGRPAVFVQHDVVKIEPKPGPNPGGQLRAWSDEGDYCEGQPEALLTRLREWRG